MISLQLTFLLQSISIAAIAMDPVTAFGLAAGVLQVVGFSLDAVKTCRELYKDGSLAGNREVQTVMNELGRYHSFQVMKASSFTLKPHIAMWHWQNAVDTSGSVNLFMSVSFRKLCFYKAILVHVHDPLRSNC